MAFLIDWVTQIIIFVLLATIIDLLIPNHGMKKYVKLTVGLILILIFLKPVFYIFQVDMPSILNQTYQELFKESSQHDELEKLIKIQKKEIQASQDAYILEQMAVQLSELANDSLRDKHQVEITDIQFEFAFGSEVRYENLENIIVTIRAIDATGTNIIEIEEVIIDTKKEIVTEPQQDVDDIMKVLREVWELDDKPITVKWEGGTH